MPYLRFSHARYLYACARCQRPILRGEPYFRDEPHPYARMRGTAESKQLCLHCVLGSAAAHQFLERTSDVGQLPLGFELTSNGFLIFPPRVEVVDFTAQILDRLARDHELIRVMPPNTFENLIWNRLDDMGFEVTQVGSGTYGKDGGIDFVACPRIAEFPFMMAVQVKHTSQSDHRIGPAPVRDLLGAISYLGFNAGLIVTNTTFTPDARWVAEQRPLLMGLRDVTDLQRWLRNDYLREQVWRNLPVQLEVCPGVIIKLPQ